MTREIIELFIETERQIWALVGQDEVAYTGLEVHLDDKWDLGSGHFAWGEVGNPYSCDLYGKAVFEGPKYTIAVGYDGQGGGPMPHLFANANRVDDMWNEDNQ